MILRKLQITGNGMKEAEEILSVKANGYHAKLTNFLRYCLHTRRNH